VATRKLLAEVPHEGTDVAFSPDGRLLAADDGHAQVSRLTQPEFGTAVSLLDTASGERRRTLKADGGVVRCVAFSRDGRLLAVGGEDRTVLIWDVAREPAKPQPEANDAALRGWWEDLAGADAAAAYRAVAELAARPAQAAKLLGGRLRPAVAAPAGRVARLIEDLNSPRFATRQAATAELEKLADLAVPALKAALDAGPPLEVRRRIDTLLEGAEGAAPTAERLRELRAVWALERAASAEARAVLREWAGGAEGARLTRAARAALGRLGKEKEL
jgi:hypothetical protein